MATTNNIKATSYQSFCIGRRGITIYQGNDLTNISPLSGDIFVKKDGSLLQYNGTAWNTYQITSDNITKLTNLTLSNGYLKITDDNFVISTPDILKNDLSLGTVSTLNYGTNAGQVPVLGSDGKLSSSIIPSVSMTNVSVVENETDKPTSAKEGDVVIVTSTYETYICSASSDTSPTWTMLEVSSKVLSVNNLTGNVVLDDTNILSTYTPVNFTLPDDSNKNIHSYISGIDNTFSNYVKKSDTGTVISYNVGNTAGQIPVLNSSGKLPASIMTSSNTITKETSTTNTFPENPNINDILINNTTRSTFIYDGSNWDQLYTPNIVSVNGYTGSSVGSTDGLVLLSGSNINSSYIPKNYTLMVDSSNKTIKTLDSFFQGIDNAIKVAGSGIKDVESSQNITTDVTDGKLTITGPDLSVYAKTSDISSKYLSLDGGTLVGNLQGTSAGFSDKIYAATPDTSSNDTSVVTSAWINDKIDKPYGLQGLDQYGSIMSAIVDTSNTDVSKSNILGIVNGEYSSRISLYTNTTGTPEYKNSYDVVYFLMQQFSNYLKLAGGSVIGNVDFSISPTVPTPASNDSSKKIATTEFVNNHSTTNVAYSTYNNLPSSPTIGMIYLVTDALKPGEETGSGTGGLCVYDGKNWMNISSGTTIEI